VLQTRRNELPTKRSDDVIRMRCNFRGKYVTMKFPRRQFLRLAAGATAPPGDVLFWEPCPPQRLDAWPSEDRL
jgi:hypothetical protein